MKDINDWLDDFESATRVLAIASVTPPGVFTEEEIDKAKAKRDSAKDSILEHIPS